MEGFMNDRRYFVLAHDTARRLAAAQCMLAPEGYVVEIKPPTRSLEQNSKLWSMLSEISKNVIWHGRRLDAESWKHVFSSSLKKMDVVPNLENTGFVALGLSTSKMTKRELSDLITLIESFAIAQGGTVYDDGIVFPAKEE